MKKITSTTTLFGWWTILITPVTLSLWLDMPVWQWHYIVYWGIQFTPNIFYTSSSSVWLYRNIPFTSSNFVYTHFYSGRWGMEWEELSKVSQNVIFLVIASFDLKVLYIKYNKTGNKKKVSSKNDRNHEKHFLSFVLCYNLSPLLPNTH